MKGLDFSKLHKVSSDEQTTTFRHPYGHEIKIVHGKLSKKLREQLDKIPVRGQKMADGGEPNPQPNESTDSAPDQQQGPQPASIELPDNNAPLDIEPVNQNQDQSQSQGQAQSDESGEQETDDAQAAADQSQDANQAPTQQESQPAQQAQPAKPSSPVSDPMDATSIEANFNKDYASLQQSINNGSIHPKTLSDIWAKNRDGTSRGTLSKLGLFFSMLASGMGSGLTHQPNALLQSMQKEIDNDLEAQKSTRSNQLTAYQLAGQHAQSMAAAKLNALEAQYYQAKTKNLPLEAQKIQQEMDMIKAQTDIYRTTNAKNLLLLDTVKMGLGMANAAPPGPVKNQLMAAHQMVSNAANQQAAVNNKQAALQMESNWAARNKALSMFPETEGLANYEAQRHLPGIGNSTIPVPQNIRDQVTAQQILDSKGQDLLGFINQHQGMDFNRWNPNDRATAQQKVEELKNFYNDSIKGGALTQGRLGWYDQQFGGEDKNPLDILPQIMGQTAKFKEMIKSNRTRLNQTLQSYGAPPIQYEEAKATPEPTSGISLTTKSGRKAVWK